MASQYVVEGRRFTWYGERRIIPVRRGWPRVWVECPEHKATHDVHMWLPEPLGVWQAAIHDRRES